MLFSFQFAEVFAGQYLEPTAKHHSWNRIIQVLLSRFGILVSLLTGHAQYSLMQQPLLSSALYQEI